MLSSMIVNLYIFASATTTSSSNGSGSLRITALGVDIFIEAKCKHVVSLKSSEYVFDIATAPVEAAFRSEVTGVVC